MLGLILTGFGLVALPLVVAVVLAVVYVDRLALQSERLVLQGVQVTLESELLAEQITGMERTARQYQVMRDPKLLDLYAEKHAQFLATLDALRRLTVEGAADSRLERMRAESLVVVAVLGDSAAEATAGGPLPERFSRLTALASGIAEHSYRLIDQELESLVDAATNARQFLVWQSLALLFGTLALVFLFTVLIARPVRQLAHAIRRLGQGAFARPIAVTGPPELETLGRELDWLRQRLLDLAEEKNRFLRNISHELKTPLASIREGAELLMDGTVGSLAEAQREVAEILRENSLELQSLIENLLHFSVQEQKRGRLSLQRFELRPLIEAVVDKHRLAILGKQLAIRIECAHVHLHADREKMHTAFDNLLSNAAKFSPPGGEVSIVVQPADGEVIIDFCDAGPGIPAGERERIFEPFYQGRTPQAGHVRGTGIGLSVVRECVRAHGGEVEIVDGPRPGTQFRLRLPAEPSA
jgi:two-component system sensor histidine kinase GlrK